jgi:hypothetical protein
MKPLSRLSIPVDGIPTWQYLVRMLWIAVQLILIICIGQKGAIFFYQAF